MSKNIVKYSKNTQYKNKKKSFTSVYMAPGIAICLVLLGLIVIPFSLNKPVIAQQGQQEETPNINASSLFNTRTIVLPNSIKNLIVTIPDEAHHGDPAKYGGKESRFIDQPFLPQNAVIKKGTNVIWFSADVNHDHILKINENSSSSGAAPFSFDSGTYTYTQNTKPIKFNNTGNFAYSDPNADSESKGFVMRGNIRVIDQTSGSSSASSSTNGTNPDTIGAFMIPKRSMDKYISDFKSHGFNIDSTHEFASLRGGQKGTGSQQILVVWTSSGMDLTKVLSGLKNITTTLPYS
jgi:hypothetical protein